jgi:hypothetical protein
VRTGGYSRRFVAVAVATALLAGVSSAVAAPSMPRLLVLVANRTTSGATSFDMQFSVTYHAEGGGFFGDLGVHVSGQTVTSMMPDGMTTFGYGDNETVTNHGTTVVSGCRDLSAVTCVDAGPGGIAVGDVSYSDTSLDGQTANHWLFVITPNVKVKFAAKGWKLRRLATTARAVRDTEADDYEINLVAHSVSVFSTAAAKGGARGSIAEAVPPCSNADIAPTREGVGTFTLDGGITAQSETCPGVAFGQAIGSWSSKPTTWRASGHVVGISTLYNARLLVVDQPARWPVG